ncbi:uncharacterized protein BO87DRAFT_379496 [Aspergillus neoniger CBS 115656]|uniref:Uncharacterized protein n=1 Tax=Aspergillus neoniger (strain CBS 115656) TaxID=1448310 RepID=A0A318Y964_ASPNB|nr:hypothetical protein BO87DRAFT_379496 [Aspergillus neoniger CBS 115656]PYH30826.1 hypothetical protein BO87DRAFT_379496 [Aspergillus neoniger CBS 115656]
MRHKFPRCVTSHWATQQSAQGWSVNIRFSGTRRKEWPRAKGTVSFAAPGVSNFLATK